MDSTTGFARDVLLVVAMGLPFVPLGTGLNEVFRSDELFHLLAMGGVKIVSKFL